MVRSWKWRIHVSIMYICFIASVNENLLLGFFFVVDAMREHVCDTQIRLKIIFTQMMI